VRRSSKAFYVVAFFKINKGIIRLVSFVLVVIILSHFAACIWFWVARINDFNHETWVFRYDLMNEEKARLYLFSLYWSFTTLTTVGYGDITAFSNDEMTISLIWMMFGVGIYSFIIGSLTSVLSNYDLRQTAIDRRVQLFEVYCKENKIPPELILEVNYYLKHNIEITSLDDHEKKGVVMSIPKKYRLQIALAMHDQAASKVAFIN
jgi:hyperpolarization activated cyclic nucleotide-gated potassium channel 1